MGLSHLSGVLENGGTVFHHAQELFLFLWFQGFGCLLGQSLPCDVGPLQPQELVEMVQSREGEIDRGGLGMVGRLQERFVVAHGVIPRVRLAERIAVLGKGRCRIRAILTHPPQIGPAGVF